MSEVKHTSGNSGLAPAAQISDGCENRKKSAPGSRAGVDCRGGKADGAGQTENGAGTRGKSMEKDAEKERQEDKKDTSELSKQSKWFGIEGKLPENIDIR